MIDIKDSHKKILTKYPRALVHMRSQLQAGRFSVIFGAGLNIPFKLPNWSTLVDDIASDADVQGQDILKRFTSRGTLPYKTELLFQHFRKRQAESAGANSIGSSHFENQTWAKFLKICSKHLYKNAPADFEKALSDHAYLDKYLPIIQETPITITYNFDDYIEGALLARRDPHDESLGYEIVTNPWSQFRRQKAVIYHPHGVLPRQLMEIPRDRLVFLESSYARLFLGALAGDFSFLLNHMSKNTCLIVGSSLEDEDLRNVLVQGGQAHPGNPHYYIHFLKAGESIEPNDEEAIRRTNFQVYNLVTLFLTEAEIGALPELLHGRTLTDDEFKDQVDIADKSATYRFYLTGPLGVGKSTASSQLRNLVVLDEWIEPRLPVLAKAWDKLTPQEKEDADAWIVKQFKVKNDNLRHRKFGIFVVDRPPMDPLAFTPPSEKAAKAKLLLDTICPGRKWTIEDGLVILLIGDPTELAARNLSSNRNDYTPEKLKQMEEDLRSVYDGEGVRIVDTRGRSVSEVTKTISEIIHFEDYKLFRFTERLEKVT